MYVPKYLVGKSNDIILKYILQFEVCADLLFFMTGFLE